MENCSFGLPLHHIRIANHCSTLTISRNSVVANLADIAEEGGGGHYYIQGPLRPGYPAWLYDETKSRIDI